MGIFITSELLHDWFLGFSKQITQQAGVDAKDDLVQNTAAGIKTQVAAAEVKQVSFVIKFSGQVLRDKDGLNSSLHSYVPSEYGHANRGAQVAPSAARAC